MGEAPDNFAGPMPEGAAGTFSMSLPLGAGLLDVVVMRARP